MRPALAQKEETDKARECVSVFLVYFAGRYKRTAANKPTHQKLVQRVYRNTLRQSIGHHQMTAISSPLRRSHMTSSAARKRLALDAIAPKVDALRKQIRQVRIDVGNALTGEELTTPDDWCAMNDLADEIVNEAESLIRYLRWQSGKKASRGG